VATPTLGFEVDGYPQTLTKLQLKNSMLIDAVEECEYIPITSPTIALRLIGRFFMFNEELGELEEHDIVDEGIEVLHVSTDDIMRVNKNIYVRKFPFDCVPIGAKEGSNNQASGLIIPATGMGLRTYIFTTEDPSHSPIVDDGIMYRNEFYTIKQTMWRYYYTPKEQRYLDFAIDKAKKEE